MEKLIKTLIERGYPEKIAIKTAENLSRMAPELREHLAKWMETEKCPDIEEAGYSTSSLMSRFKEMTYPAALLTIDWLKREPKKASEVIEKGIR